ATTTAADAAPGGRVDCRTPAGDTMTVRTLSCPQCAAKVNALATMQSVRCPGCGNVFAASASASAATPGRDAQQPHGAARSKARESDKQQPGDSTMMLV